MKSEIDSFQHFSVMERGASHKEKNMPLQDFASSLRGECSDKENKTINYVIASISDGHGSSQHFRSDRGAKFACEAVKEAFCEFMEKAKDFSSDKNQNKLKELIYENWRDKVIKDISDEPFKKIEIEEIDKDEQKKFQYTIDTLKKWKYSYDVLKKVERKLKEYKQAEKQLKEFGLSLKDDFKAVKKSSELYLSKEFPFKNKEEWEIANKYYKEIKGTLNYLLTAYGCTLISVLSCDKFTLAVQIGDGSCVAFYKDGSCNIPIPEDKKNMANITTSLCRQNHDECRIHIFKERPVAVFVTSDGIDDSYGRGESLFNFYRRLCFNFSEKGIGFKDELQASLREISSRGSKDDISISGIYDEYKLSKLKDVIKKRYEEGVYKARLAEIQDQKNDYNLNTLNEKLITMEKQKERTKEKINSSESRKTAIQRIITSVLKFFAEKLRLPDFSPKRDKMKIIQWKDEKQREISGINKELNKLHGQFIDLYEKIEKKENERKLLESEFSDFENELSKYNSNTKELNETIERIEKLRDEERAIEEKYGKFRKMYNDLKKTTDENLENEKKYKSKIDELDKEIEELLNNIGDIENPEIYEELTEPINQESTFPTEPINQESIYPAEPINQENHFHIVVEKIKLNKETYPLIHNEHQEEDTNDEQAIEEKRKNTNIDIQ